MPAIKLQDVVLGQYVGNPNATDADEKQGYLDDPGVPKNSITPTYALAVAWIKNERWDGVPFFLRCGKGNWQKAELLIKKCENYSEFQQNFDFFEHFFH